jgi:signal transduction histidine kinase
MIAPKEYFKEKERLKDLDSYSILDTLSETDYDNLTAIASEICDTPISLISLIDTNRQWFKSSHGLNAVETPRDYAFCAHAINDINNTFIVEDARLDERFHDNPLVLGGPSVVFYAGVPLISEDGFPLGTLCVIDQKPKKLNAHQIQSLNALSQQVMNLLNLRKSKLLLEKTLVNLEEKNEELERFAIIAAHDLKSPLIGISGMAQLFSEIYGHQVDSKGQEMLSLIESSSNNLRILIDGLLDYSKSDSVLKERRSIINLDELKKEIFNLFNYEQNLTLNFNTSLNDIVVNKTVLEQILINLISNSIKYCDKDEVKIEIGINSLESHYEFYVNDNGPGIAKEYQEKIFKIFEVLTAEDKFGRAGNGIGLATVKKIVEKSGGIIKVESEIGKGSTFMFTIEKKLA